MSAAQQPSIGRVVHYRLSQEDVDVHGHLLNGQQAGDYQPALIVRTWESGLINLRVIVDGPGPDLWRTSVGFGDDNGQWIWPPRV